MPAKIPILYVTANGVGNAWVPGQVLGLRERGIDVSLVALRPPESVHSASEAVRALAAETRAVYPLRPARVLRGLRTGLRPERLSRALAAALGPEEPTPARRRLRLLAQVAAALDLIARLPERPVHVHADMAHAPASVGLLAARLLGVGFSFTGHANDLFPERVALRRKLREARFAVAISRFHAQLYREAGADASRIARIPVGVPVEAFPFRARADEEAAAPRIRSVGRLVPKKGFDVLLDACAKLVQRGCRFELEIAGSGPEEARLRRRLRAQGLEAHVTLTGRALRQEELPGFLAGGHLFCLPCVPGPDGDVDGLPLVLLEAACSGLPLVSTRLAGIPDLIEQNHTGLLAEPGDAEGLAAALERLIGSARLRGSLARAARQRVEAEFDSARTLDRLAEALRAATRDAAAPRPGREEDRSPGTEARAGRA